MAMRAEGEAVAAAAWWLLLAAAATVVGAAAWLVLDGQIEAAGAATAAAGLLLVAVAVEARGRERTLPRVLHSFADRSFDGCVFASIAWATRGPEPAAAAAALIALGAGFLAAYVRARAESLRYQVEESVVTRAIRYGIVSLGLLAGRLAPALFAVAAFTVLAALVRASQVAKEERA